jgi:hypothetical protein
MLTQISAATGTRDAYLVTNGFSLCTGSLVDGGSQCGAIPELFGFPMATDSSGLWTANARFGGVPVASVSVSGPRLQLTIPLPDSWGPARTSIVQWDTGAVLWGGHSNGIAIETMLLLERDGALVLKRFPENLEPISVTGTWAALRQPSTDPIYMYRR